MAKLTLLNGYESAGDASGANISWALDSYYLIVYNSSAAAGGVLHTAFLSLVRSNLYPPGARIEVDSIPGSEQPKDVPPWHACALNLVKFKILDSITAFN